MRWHILTGEYEPQPGGVSDYTTLVAHALACEGDEVHVWTPSPGAPSGASGVVVHRLPDHFGPRALTELSRYLRSDRSPRRVLVQYVPQALGWKGANLGVCLWLRTLTRESIWVMFHEVAQPTGRDQPWLRNGLGVVTRVMAGLVARSAERIFVSTPAWTPEIRAMRHLSTPIRWLPVPSAIPTLAGRSDEAWQDDRTPACVRAARADGHPLVGNFGTCGALITPGLFEALHHLARQSQARFVLFGRGSDLAARRAVEQYPALAGRLHGAGALAAAEVSRYLTACDVMLQPYPDGVTSRRTSVMAALAHGRPVVTTLGPLTEPLWHASAGVRLAPANDPAALAANVVAILKSPDDAARLSHEALAIYDGCFALRHTIAALRARI